MAEQRGSALDCDGDFDGDGDGDGCGDDEDVDVQVAQVALVRNTGNRLHLACALAHLLVSPRQWAARQYRDETSALVIISGC